jgi:hypothetical protein
MNSAGPKKAFTICDLRFTSALDFGAQLQGFNARTLDERVFSLIHSAAVVCAIVIGHLVVSNSVIAATQAETPAKPILAPESQQESDWVDARWNQSEVGPFLASNLSVPGAKIAKGLSIKVGENGEGVMCYDTANAAWRGAWLGGFLRFDAARYGLLRAPTVVGQLLLQAPPPTSQSNFRYHGLHLNGKRVVLEYTLGKTRILESPWLDSVEGTDVFSRTLNVGPLEQPFVLPLATADKPQISPVPRGWSIQAKSKSDIIQIRISALNAKVSQQDSVLLLELPSQSEAQSVEIAFCRVDQSKPETSNQAVEKHATLPTSNSLAPLLEPGRPRWLPDLETRGQRGLDLDILAVDTLTVPYDNPWKALMFLAGVDFTSDGTAYVCSIHGDVWRVTGIDDSLRNLRWHRFATGLFQALGLKIRNDEIFVLGRDQITRLHDQNKDGEADYYENFCNQIQTSTGGHDFVTCLEKDDAGNFYYVDPRGLHRVSADGQSVEHIASGWRNPNGMGVSPDGKILTVAPQQGEWTPSSQISEAKLDGYYGYGGPRKSLPNPVGYDVPLCWIPHAADNSSGSQVWVPPAAWGPLAGHMLHLLWGRCGLMMVLRDQVDGISQGAVLNLPGRFLSGPNRGSFNGKDGHLYIAGSTGWQTAAVKDGCLQRVRFTGKPVYLPVGWHAHSNGLTLTFSQPLQREAATDPGSYSVHQWNYRYASSYGSKDWSVAEPRKEGRDEVAVKAAHLLGDGKTIFLEMPGLIPVMQMEIKYSLNATDGKALRNQLWVTLNALEAEKRP